MPSIPLKGLNYAGGGCPRTLLALSFCHSASEESVIQRSLRHKADSFSLGSAE